MIKPNKKSLGQNFLINRGVLEKLVNAAEPDKSDVVLEIGPGTGILTEKLAEKVGKIVAVEKDRRLIELLKNKFERLTSNSATAQNEVNVEIVEGDILKLDIGKLFENCKLKIENSDYKVVGNIPYYITSHLLKTIFEKWPMPELIVLMVQKEVAQRIMARPPRMNLLALSVQFFAEPKIVSYVSRGSFRPIPKVDSAVVKLVPHHKLPITNYELQDKFFKLIKTAFAEKRKQLKNTVGLELLNKVSIKPESRPEELSLEDWLNLASRV